MDMEKKRESYQSGQVILVGKVWKLRYREEDIDGNITRPSEAIGTLEQYPTKAKAEQAAEPIRQRINDARKVIHFGDLCDKYLAIGLPDRKVTRRVNESYVRRLRAVWGNRRLDWMASPEGVMVLEDWFRNMPTLPRNGKTRPTSLKTRSNVKDILSQLFFLAVKWGYLRLGANPIKLINLRGLSKEVRTPKERTYITLEQYGALLLDPKLPEHARVFLQLSTMTGLNPSECLGLRWEDVDFDAEVLWVRRSYVHGNFDDPKTTLRGGSVPMHEGLAAIMRKWMLEEQPVEGWVFGNLATGKPFQQNGLLERHIAPAGARLDIDGLTLYSFRHTYRSLMDKLELPLNVQQELMRHAKLATTMKYASKHSTERADRVRGANAKVVEILKRAGNGGR
jgi:integrase